MKWWRRRPGCAPGRWLADKMLDEALNVFGTLQAAAYLDDPRLDGDLRERFRVTALDVLDESGAEGVVTLRRPSLDDVFLTLTSPEARSADRNPVKENA